VAFVLSRGSAASPICQWEVGEADRLGKRVIPVICAPLGEAAPPQRLRDLNYIFFYPEEKSPGSGFGAGLKRLVAALKLDLNWVRDQTRYGLLAASWEDGGKAENRLLLGSDVAAAKTWLERRPRTMPEPSETVRNFIRASEEAETRRMSEERRRLAEITAAQEERERGPSSNRTELLGKSTSPPTRLVSSAPRKASSARLLVASPIAFRITCVWCGMAPSWLWTPFA